MYLIGQWSIIIIICDNIQVTHTWAYRGKERVVQRAVQTSHRAHSWDARPPKLLTILTVSEQNHTFLKDCSFLFIPFITWTRVKIHMEVHRGFTKIPWRCRRDSTDVSWRCHRWQMCHGGFTEVPWRCRRSPSEVSWRFRGSSSEVSPRCH